MAVGFADGVETVGGVVSGGGVGVGVGVGAGVFVGLGVILGVAVGLTVGVGVGEGVGVGVAVGTGVGEGDGERFWVGVPDSNGEPISARAGIDVQSVTGTVSGWASLMRFAWTQPSGKVGEPVNTL